MKVFLITLIPKQIPVTYDYHSALVISANSEEEARNMANEKCHQGAERVIDLDRVKAHYISFGDMKESFAKHGQELTYNLYQELAATHFGYVENNHIWDNPEYTEIVEIGSSHSTNPEVHACVFHAG